VTSPPPPTVPAGPLDTGRILAGTVTTYLRRPGLFLGLTLLPTALIGALVLGWIAWLVLFAAGRSLLDGEFPAAGPFVGSLVALVLGLMLVSLYQYRCLGMMSVATVELAEGRTPTWRGVHERTRGMMPRILALVVLVGLGGMLLAGVLAVVLIAPLASTRSEGELERGVGFILLFWLVAALVAVWLTVRWLFLVPAMALEGLSGFGALGRSWRLTRGSFWLTLGQYLLVSILVGVPVSVVQAVAQVALLPLLDESSLGDPMVQIGAATRFGLALMVVAIRVTPVTTIWYTLMYLARRRRIEGPSPVPQAWGSASAPQAWGSASTAWGQASGPQAWGPPSAAQAGAWPPPVQGWPTGGTQPSAGSQPPAGGPQPPAYGWNQRPTEGEAPSSRASQD